MKKVIVISIVVCLLAVLFVGNVAHAYTIYSDQSTFTSALSNYNIVDFENYPVNSHVSINGDEYSSSGVTFYSPLSSPLGNLYVESGWYYSSNFLSVDKEPEETPDDGNEDDMVFNIINTAYAFGVSIVDNMGGSESITVSGLSGVLYSQTGSIPNFFGIIADDPITQVFFNEQAWDHDDIGYDNIIIGNISTTVVPEPISSILFIAGGATLGFRRLSKKFPTKTIYQYLYIKREKK